MDKKKKPKIIQKSARYYTPAEREEIIKEYLSGGYSKQEIWLKYTGHADERGHLLNWMRELGYATAASVQGGSLSFPTRQQPVKGGPLSFPARYILL